MRWLLFVACALDYSVCKNEDKDQTRDATTRPPPPPIGPFAPGGNPLAFTAKPLEVLQQTFTPSIPEQFLQTKASNQQASTSRSFSFLDTKSPANGKGVSFQLNVQHPVQKSTTPKPDEVLHVGRLPERGARSDESPRNEHSHQSGISGEIALVGDRPVVLSDAHKRLSHKHLEREENPATHTLSNVHFTAQKSNKQDGIYFVPPVTPADRAVTGDDLLNTIRPSNNIITPTDLPKIPEPLPRDRDSVEQRSFADPALQNTIPVNGQETAEPGRGSRDTGLFQDINTGVVAPQQNTRFIQGVTGDRISVPESDPRVQDSDERMSRIEADFHNGRRTALEQGVRDPSLVPDSQVQSKVDFTKESFEESFRRQKEELERKFSAKEFDPATLSVTEFPRAETFLPERSTDSSSESPAKRQNQIVRKNPNFQDGLGDARTKTIDFTIESKHHSGAVTTQTFKQVVPLRSRLRQQTGSSNRPSQNRDEVLREVAPIAPEEPQVVDPASFPEAPVPVPAPNPAAQRQTFNRAVLEDQRRYREELRLFEEDQRKYREQQRKFEEEQRRFEENRKRFEDEEKRFNEQRKKYEQERQRFETERGTRTPQLTQVQRKEEPVDLKSVPPPPRRVQNLGLEPLAPVVDRDRPRVDDFTTPEAPPTPKPPRNRVRIPIESRHFTIEHVTQSKTPNVEVVDVQLKIPPSPQELPVNHKQSGEVIDDPFFPVPLSNPTQRPSTNSFSSPRGQQQRNSARSSSKKGFNFSQGTIYTDGPSGEPAVEQRRTLQQRNSTSTSSRNRNAVQKDSAGFGGVQPVSNENSQKQQDHIIDNSQNGGGDLPGTPGVDYPIYSIVPDTSFNCKTQESAGMYADIETGCQAFHNCDPLGHKMSFLCPNGTVFKQELFICDWWYNVQCNDSDKFFHLNTNKYTTPRPRRRRRRGDGKRKASA